MAKEATNPVRARGAIISNTLKFFIILSVLAHVGAGLFWGIPAYLLRESEREAARMAAEIRAQITQNAKRSAEIRHAAEVEKTKEDIAAVLRKNLQTMLNDQADAKTAKALEDRLLHDADIQKAMGNYASALLDGFASDEDLRNLSGELESAFVETAYAEYRDLHAELLAAEFLEHVEKEVAPKISEHYRQEFDGKIAHPFKSEADKIASQAQQEEQARRNAVQGSLTQAKSRLEAAGNEIGQARGHLRQGMGGDAHQTATAAGNVREPSLDDALKSLQGARQAAETGKAKARQAGDMLSRANSQDAKARQTAEQQAGQALGEAGKAVAEAARAIAQAAPAAERFGGPAAQAMKEAVDQAAQAVAETAATTAPLTTARTGEATRRAEALGAAVAEAQKTLQAAGTEFSTAGKNAASAHTSLNQGMEATRKGIEALAKGPEAPYAQATRQARDSVSTALDAVQATEKAIAEGNGAPSQGAAGNAAQAIAKGLESTQAAMVAVGQASVTDSWAKAGIENIVDTELRQVAQKAFTESLEKDAMPRLAKALAGTFRDKMRKNGITNEEVERKVAVRVEELLDTQVAGGAGTGAAGVLEGKFRGYSGAHAGDLQGQAASSIGQAAAAQAGEAQGKLLAERLPGIAGNAQADGRFAGMAGEFGDGNDMGLEDRLAKLAEGVKSGRVALLGNGAGKGGAMVELRNMAMGRAGNGSGSGSGRPGGRPGVGRGSPLRIDSEEYKRLMGLLENRDNDAAKGGQWNLAGAEGEASHAGTAEEYRAPAMVVDPKAASEKANIENAQPYEPTFKTLRFSSIPCLNKPFAMNGDFSKWKDLPSVQLQGETHVDGQPDSQVLQIAWDATGLYFHLAIKKPGVPVHKVEQKDFPIGDGIEVWVDTLNSKEKSRDRNNGQQFWFWPFGSASDPNASGGESIFSKKTGFTYQVYGPDKTQRAAKQTPDGWEMECKIPCERLWDADLVPGRILGMNIYANTGTALNYYWSSSKRVGTWGFPNTWGDVLLAGSDGDVQVIARKTPGGAPDRTVAETGASGAKTPPTIAVGEPLRLRVTDKDMSGTEGRRGKVQVTVRARQGKAQTVILEETTAGGGVFEGAVRTALALDEDAPGTLSLFEGDIVDIVYNDQARANGARNAEVRIQARAGVAVLADVPTQRASAQTGARAAGNAVHLPAR